MKKILLLSLCLGFYLMMQAADVRSVATTPGNLSKDASAYLKTVTSITITGSIDARDFKTLRDEMPLLEALDLSAVKILAYTGELGTEGPSSLVYSANTIPQYAFYDWAAYAGKVSLVSVSLPLSLTAIGNSAFAACRALESVSIPSSVVTIGSYAFQNCSGLNSISIPSSVTSIGSNALYYCSAVINVDASNLFYSSVDGVLFNKDQSKLIQCPISKTGSYIIPSTVNSIGGYAFADCTVLSSITIPSSVSTIGSYAFSNCMGLSSLIIPSSVTSIGNFAFAYCYGLLSIHSYSFVPLRLATNSCVFSAVNKNTCTIHVLQGSGAAYKAAALWKDFINIVEIPIIVQPGTLGTLLTPDQKANLTSLTLTGILDARDFVTLRDEMPLLAILDIGAVSIAEYTGTKGTVSTGSVTYPAKEIPQSAFFNAATSVGKKTLTTVVMPTSLSSIGSRAFDHCTALSSVVAPSGLSAIGSYAFSYCSGLTSVTLPASVNSIGNYAFLYSTGLISVDAANRTYSSVDGVLLNKSKTTLIQCPVSKTGSYVIPSTVTSIGDYALAECTGFTSIDIPSTLRTIGSYTFFNCKGIASIRIPSSVTTIGSHAFDQCTGLSSIYAFSATPIVLPADSYVFSSVDKTNCILHVPVGSVTAYKKALQWKDFLTVVDGLIMPILTTQAVTAIGSTTAIGNGNIVSLGDVNPTQYGVVWSTLPNPTIALATKTTQGPRTTTGAFTSSITGLEENQKYYVKAYATNNSGTSYGEEMSFTTSSPALTFKSSTTGNLSLSLKMNVDAPFYIDWGNGVLVLQTPTVSNRTFTTNSYVAGNVVNVFATGIVELNIASQKISTLDVRKSTLLTVLDCSKNQLKALDLSKNTSLTFLECSSNQLASLDLSNNTILSTLQCSSNKFDFTSLPQNLSVYADHYRYAPQGLLSAFVTAGVVDLSSQLSAKDIRNVTQNTVYTWYTKTSGTRLLLNTDYVEQKGVFTFLTTPTDSVYCTMTNAAFPAFAAASVLKTVNLKVKALAPTVTTLAVINIGTTYATANGAILNFGVTPLAQFGMVWSAASNPTVELSTKTIEGSKGVTGAFASALTGLNPNTAYFVKAYAINTAGVAYGEELRFTTTPLSLSVSATTIRLAEIAGSSNTVSVLSNTTWKVGIDPAAKWLSVSPADATTGNATLTFTAQANTGAVRTAQVTLSAAGLDDKTITVIQSANSQISVPNVQVTISKVYDKTTSATVNVGALSGVQAGDVVVLKAIANYEDVNVGVGKKIAIVFSLEGADAFKYKAPANYSINTGSITARPITIAADVQQKTYGDADPIWSAQVTAGSVLAGDLLSGSLVRAANENVGVYPINKGSYSYGSNYEETYISANFTITKRAITISADAKTKSYGDADPVFTAQLTIGSIVLGDLVSGSLIRTANEHVGVYPINKGSYSYGKNYIETFVSADLTIGKRAITISADAMTKIYGDKDPHFTAQITAGNIASGDVASGLLARIANENVGSYPISQGSYTYGDNYIETFESHDLTITNRTITVKARVDSKIYDGNTVSNLLPTVDGLVAGDAVGIDPIQVFDGKNAGLTHVLIPSGLTIQNGGNDVTTNYTIQYVSSDAVGVIERKLVSVTSPTASNTKVYDGDVVANVKAGFLSGVFPCDQEDVFVVAKGVYSDAGVGADKTITVHYELTGIAAENYSVPSNLIFTISGGEILRKQLGISAPTAILSKMFDGNSRASLSAIGTLQGVAAVDIDKLGVNAVATYDDEKISDDKVITVEYTLTGSALGNYFKPDNDVIKGAKILEEISLSPLASPTEGCEGSELDLAYSVLTGKPTQYKIDFSSIGRSSSIPNIDYVNLPTSTPDGTVSIPIPDGTPDGTYQGTFQVRNELGYESAAYTFQFVVNVSSDYIIPKFNDVVLCNNSAKRFTAYQWFKNGVLIEGATKQFYNDINGLVGTYSIQLTTVTGETLYTCPKALNISLPSRVKAYPNPVKTTQACIVQLTGISDDELNGAVLSVYNTQGICIYKTTNVQKVNTLNLSVMDGVYVGHIITSKGNDYQFKVVVEN